MLRPSSDEAKTYVSRSLQTTWSRSRTAGERIVLRHDSTKRGSPFSMMSSPRENTSATFPMTSTPSQALRPEACSARNEGVCHWDWRWGREGDLGRPD